MEKDVEHLREWEKVAGKTIDILDGRIAALEAKPRRGRPPKPGQPDEIEGAELASELEPTE
jgi:hypothetical protein